MHGPAILAATMSTPQDRGKAKTSWQYHSQSDRHSKVACWGVLYDLLRTSALLRKHAEEKKIVFGINFKMNDYANDREKDLDLVIARPSGSASFSKDKTFVELAEKWDIELTSTQRSELLALPAIMRGQLAGAGVQIALEAKASMTAHVKALPRLYDELNSSHQMIHGASSHALAVGMVIVNVADTFISPKKQVSRRRLVVSRHNQPAAAEATIAKVKKIRRRTTASEAGFDGLGIIAIDLKNDGTPVTLATDPPAPQPGSIFYYDDMLVRIANEYDASFSSI
ncbi:MAG TPA: hypothetical protein VH853_20075 [Polyangia bacterium]|jgi:hypothetical protein|nr:hypothetical protein [Polyangia bacterium]